MTVPRPPLELEDDRPGIADGGRIVGALATGEDRFALEHALRSARRLVLEGRVSILLHGGSAGAGDGQDKMRAERLARLRAGRLTRYVFRCDTAAGTRVVKIAEVATLGGLLRGFARSSVARLEHRAHRHCEALGVAATRSLGYLELRRGPLLVRALQVQTPLPADAVSLDDFFERELAAHGDVAIDALADAIVATHERRFFHADLKGFHGFVSAVVPGAPARYNLVWLDLRRVAFRLTERRRLINLYQVFRFVLPDSPDAQARFMRRYGERCRWPARRTEGTLARTRRLLARRKRHRPTPLE